MYPSLLIPYALIHLFLSLKFPIHILYSHICICSMFSNILSWYVGSYTYHISSHISELVKIPHISLIHPTQVYPSYSTLHKLCLFNTFNFFTFPTQLYTYLSYTTLHKSYIFSHLISSLFQHNFTHIHHTQLYTNHAYSHIQFP